MMDSVSTLQKQFPLSPRKFWKKVLPKIFGFFLAISAPIFITIILIASEGGPGALKMWHILTILGISIFLFSITIIPYVWYVKVYIKRYYYNAEKHFITIKKGVFAPGEIHVQWQKIQDVYVDQDVIDRVMGLYDVHIASATINSGIEAHIDGVEESAAEGLKKLFLDKVANGGKIDTEDGTSTQTSRSHPRTLELKEDISNDTYPLSTKWTILALLNRFIYSIFLPILIIYAFIGGDNDLPSIIDHWSYVLLVCIALGILMMIIQTITLFIWKRNYAFKFTPEHIYHREGVISLSEKHMPYSSIQDVNVTQGVMERLFGLARVIIQNASQQPTYIGRRGEEIRNFAGIIIQGLSLADANRIANVLKTTTLGKNNLRYGL